MRVRSAAADVFLIGGGRDEAGVLACAAVTPLTA
jgi:hypothetical protein